MLGSLEVLLREHQAAVDAYDACLAALRRGGGRDDPAATQRTLDAAQAVIVCRLEVYQHLRDHGWHPPAELAAEMAVDRVLLVTPTSAAGG
jgi:hypothetical protein